jgi:hypothetical protein
MPAYGDLRSINSPSPTAVMSEKKTLSNAGVTAVPEISIGDSEVQGFDAAGTKKLLRKLDWHIIPFMSLIYL